MFGSAIERNVRAHILLFRYVSIYLLTQDCIVPNGGSSQQSGSRLINIKKLHDVLRDELNIVQNSIATGQRQLILQETESILKYAIELNSEKNTCIATTRFMEAWGHVRAANPAFHISH